MQKHTNKFIIFLGILGSICFSVSAVPEVLSALATSKVGITDGTLILWFTGELCSVVYVLYKDKDKIQLANYLFNLTCITVLIYFKYMR